MKPNHSSIPADSSSLRGFTLVEMILVITIMAIMLGGIAPNFKPFLEGSTIKDAAETLASILRYTRSLSIERSAITQLTFDEETGDIVVMVESEPIDMPGTYETVNLPVRYPKKYRTDIQVTSILKQSLAGSQQENVISFQPDGTTSDTFIYLADQYERIGTVGIVGLTGQVLVWHYKAENFYE